MSATYEREVVSAPGWNWETGMLLEDRSTSKVGRVVSVNDTHIVYREIGCEERLKSPIDLDLVPVLSDSRTSGAILRMVREAWGQPRITSVPLANNRWGIAIPSPIKSGPKFITNSEEDSLCLALINAPAVTHDLDRDPDSPSKEKHMVSKKIGSSEINENGIPPASDIARVLLGQRQKFYQEMAGQLLREISKRLQEAEWDSFPIIHHVGDLPHAVCEMVQKALREKGYDVEASTAIPLGYSENSKKAIKITLDLDSFERMEVK